MRAAIFGVKYNNSLNTFLDRTTEILKDYNVTVDDEYYKSSLEDDKANPEKLYSNINKILLKSDIIIIENSDYSNGIGFLIGKASEMKKPVLVLFNKEQGTLPSVVIKSYEQSKRLDFAEYDSKNIVDIIHNFVKDSKKLLNTKYLFNLTPDMAKYLQWSSEEYNKPMVDILRELLNARMDSDKRWKDYIA